MNGLAMVWTRWTDRETNRAYIRSSEQIQSWKETGTRVFVSTTGTAPIDKTTQTFISAGAVHIPCQVGNPDHRLPLVLRKVFLVLLKDPTLTHIGVVDDDALFRHPDVTSLRIKEVVQKNNPGACGPIHGVRWWRKFGQGKNVPESFWENNGYASLWGTTMHSAGCQIYLADALRITAPWWKSLFKSLIWRSDYPLFMMIHSRGYPIGEFYCKGYDHSALNASKAPTKSVEWLESRAEMLRIDAKQTHMFFSRNMELVPYIPLLERIIKSDVRVALNFAVKGGLDRETSKAVFNKGLYS